MKKSTLPVVMYKAFDFFNRGDLDGYYKEVKKKNIEHSPVSHDVISCYLNMWGGDSVLEKNPIMTKKDISNWVVKVKSSSVNFWAYTGGSYGEPFKIPYSKRRCLIKTATFRYFNEAAGYQLGDPFCLIRAKDRSSVMKFLRNETIFFPGDISMPRIKELVSHLKEKKIEVLMGYPSVIYEVALYLERHPLVKSGLFLKSVISVSEPFEEFKREFVYNIFGCNVLDRYSNEEVGLIAQQDGFGGEYYVNNFGVCVEIVDEETLQPVKEGEQGKVVVTDVFNDLVPVIRYDTGDLATAVCYKEGRLLTIGNIEGRVSEKIFSTKGNPVSPLVLGPFIHKPLSSKGHVCQYQFAQTDVGEYEVRIKIDKSDVSELVIRKILAGLKSVLGSAAEIRVVFCDNIASLPSGKRPVFKNEMNGMNF